ncbi:MAG: hypothetical protein A2Z99_06095 [Treponema sp. GWB1_62_6]|nr:MAG: hypothetical protein A2Z99_06095 [Treponema sp. GWB1_62_6]
MKKYLLIGLGLALLALAFTLRPVAQAQTDMEVQPAVTANGIQLQRVVIEPNVPVTTTTVTPGAEEGDPDVTTIVTTYHVQVQAEVTWTKNGSMVWSGTKGAKSAGLTTPRKLGAAWTTAGNLLTAMKASIVGGTDL